MTIVSTRPCPDCTTETARDCQTCRGSGEVRIHTVGVGPGRPPLPEEELRGTRLYLRVSDREREIIGIAASYVPESVSEYVRRAVLQRAATDLHGVDRGLAAEAEALIEDSD